MNWRVIHTDEYRCMPWKNGGGETVEVLALPRDAGLDDFEIRISMATVASDGSFSTFADIDRTLCLLKGNGLLLTVGDRPPDTIGLDSEPLSFSGNLPAFAKLVDGPVTDFNVMTRRRLWRHAVQRVTIKSSATIELDRSLESALVFCQSGELTFDTETGAVQIAAFETLQIDGPPRQWTLRATQPTTAFLIELRSVSA